MLNTYLIDLGLMVNREKGNRDIRKEERASKSVQFREITQKLESNSSFLTQSSCRYDLGQFPYCLWASFSFFVKWS